MRKNPHVRIRGGLGSVTALVYPTPYLERLSMFPRLLAATVVVISLFLSTQSSAQIAHRRLTSEEIESALAAGIREEPEPYFLRQEAVLEDGSVIWVTGFKATVTTPYWRVQSAASKAWRENRHRLTPEEIPLELLAPVARINIPFGIPQPANHFTHEYFSCETEGKMEFAVFRKGSVWANNEFDDNAPQEFRPMRPLWQTEADLAVGPWGPQADDGITAVYPLEFLRSDLEFVLMHKNHDGDCHGIMILGLRVMQIRPADLATWR